MGVSDICWWSGVAGMCTVYMNSELTSPATSDSSSRDNEIYLPLEVLLPVEDGEFDFSWCGLPSPSVIKLRKLLPPVMDSDEAAGDPICRYSILRSQREITEPEIYSCSLLELKKKKKKQSVTR
jgi:hypothetical protein